MASNTRERRGRTLSRSTLARMALAWSVPYVSVTLGLHVLESAWLAIVFYHAIAVVVLTRTAEGRAALSALARIERPTATTARATGFGLAVAFGLAGGVCLLVLAPLAIPPTEAFRAALEAKGLAGASWIFFAGYHALVNPWIEEAYWRGLLAPKSASPAGASHGLAPVDVAFAGYHAPVLVGFVTWPWALVSVVLLTLAAWLWRRVRVASNGLLLPSISHLAGDAAVMSVALHLTR